MSNAQIAKWLITPSYDAIYMASGIDAVVTDSLNTKTFWTFNGKKILQTTDEIFDFKENRAVSFIPGTTTLAHIYKDDGEILDVGHSFVNRQFPYYSCNRLLVNNGEYYWFLDEEGEICGNNYINAYPFFNGYALCRSYLNLEKQKDPYMLLITDEDKKVDFSFNGKVFEPKDVEFISSVNDEGIAIVVIKSKLFIFNGKDRSLSPVYATETEMNPKNQAKLNGEFMECYRVTGDKETRLTAKCGKSTNVSFEFDNLLRPVSFSSNGNIKIYSTNAEPKKEYFSNLRLSFADDMFGIDYGDIEILPPQLDSIMACFGNKAFVKLNGKCGMLEVSKTPGFSIKINKGNDVAFLHQKFETKIRVDMPDYILSDKTYLSIEPESGLSLEKTSREKKNTESGNYVEYGCVLTIPENLADDIEEISYPVQVLYNELKSPIINHKIKAWHYKKFEVDEDENQRVLEDGTLTFVFNIKNTLLDESIVKFDVSVSADTLKVQREDKISETRYKYKVYGLNEGTNNIVVKVLEQGCPPAVFPFEVEYHKPVAETKTTPAEEEKVVIKKKARLQQQPSSPRLKI